MQQLIDGAVEADKVIDVYAEAGVGKPEISLLSEETLAKIRAKPYQSLQIALLKKILSGQIGQMRKSNKVRSTHFAEALAATIQRYENRTLSDAEIIAALVQLAKSLREEDQRAVAKGLSTTELAFYDAVIQNASAMELGDDTLKKIAQELVLAVRSSATLDWRDRDSVQAELRIKVKTLLKRHKYRRTVRTRPQSW
jgi:type I restriction enzyme R subunit